MFRSRRYRVDNEQLVLVLTVLLVGAVIVLTSSVTFCLSGVFIIGMFAISAFTIRAHHRALMHTALPVNAVQTPEVDKLVRTCSQKLQPGPIDVYLVKKNQLNAYTFGISDPKALVVYTPMVQVMTPGELSFVIGHEMGHVALGHTWLNTILGGMAGIPVADWPMCHEDSAETLKGYDEGLFGGRLEQVRDRYVQASPLTYIEAIQAPVLIIQGRNDTRCPARQVEVFEERMRALGKPLDVVWFDAGHGSLVVEQTIQHYEAILRFGLKTAKRTTN